MKKVFFFAVALVLLTAGVYGQSTTQTCTNCKGKGTVQGTIKMGKDGNWYFPDVKCTTCNGTGKITVAAPKPAPAPAPSQNNTQLAEAALERGHVAFERGLKETNTAQIKQNLNTAIAEYTEAIRLNPQVYMAYGNRAICNHILLNYRAAIADIDAAIRIKPDVQGFRNLREVIVADAARNGVGVPAPQNNASPSSSGSNKTLSTCTLCNGKGQLFGDFSSGYMSQPDVYCSICGRVMSIHSHVRCTRCNGTGLF